MTLEEAYQRLGLKPLDDFIEQAAGRIDPSGVIRPGDYRQIGASTWMCVSAVLALRNGQNVLILAKTIDEAKRLRDVTIKFADQLGLRPIQQRKGPVSSWNESTPDFSTVCKGELRWGRGRSGVVGVVGKKGKPFNDDEWKQRAICRSRGPFAMVRRIVREGDKYAAYDEDGEFLMDLSLEGATQIVRSNRSSIHTERFQVTEEWEEAIVSKPPNLHDRTEDPWGTSK